MALSPEMHSYFSEALKKHRVVVIGAGFAGLEVVIQLRKSLGRKLDIMLVDKSEHFIFRPFVHFLLRDLVKPEELKIDLREFARKWQVNFIRGEVTGVDYENKRVIFDPEGELYFDFLVIAVGAVSAARYKKGFERMFQIRSIDDIQVLKQHLENYCGEFKKKVEFPDVPANRRFVVIGGGIAGIENLFELWHFIRKRCRKENVDFDTFEFLLVEQKGTILADKNEKLIRYIDKQLEKKGIRVLVSHKVINAGREFIECKINLKNSEALTKIYGQEAESVPERVTIKARTIVWAGGVRPNPVIKKFSVPLDSKYNQGIEVQTTLEVEKRQDIFAAGDCICWVQNERLQPVAATGHNAIRQGRVIAKNIERGYENKKRYKTYYPNVHTPHWISLNGFIEGLFAIGPRVLKHPSALFGWLKRRIRSSYFTKTMPLQWQDITQTINPQVK